MEISIPLEKPVFAVPTTPVLEKFLGQKERRRTSASKLFLGDYLNLTAEPSIIKLLAKNGDTTISFADIVVKINKRNKPQERIMLLTDKHYYNIDPGNYKVKRKIPYQLIGDVKLSKLPDNFFCMHVPSEYDYLIESSKKTEIITRIAENYEKCTKKPLMVTFSNCYTYCIEKNTYREIQFTVVRGGVSTQIFAQRKAK